MSSSAPRKRLIASFVGGWGHVEPLLPVVSVASGLGHDVSFAGQEAVADRLRRLGHRVDVVGPDTLRTDPAPLVPVDRVAEQSVMRDHFVADYGGRRATSLTALFEREKAEVVVCDEVDVGAVVAAERLGIPCVTVNVVAAGRLTGRHVVGSAWSDLRRVNGLPPDPACHRMSGSLALAPVPRSFRDRAAPTSGRTRFVRPAIIDQLADPGPRRPPSVFVSLGTVFNLESGDLLGRLVRAMNRFATTEGVDVFIATGPNIGVSELPAAGPRVHLSEFIPLAQVLGGCGTVVCHGGSGTVVAALSLGIPVVVLPIGADQPDNADRCIELGVGVVLDPLTATPGEIALATLSAMRDPELRAGARALELEAAAQPRTDDVTELHRILAS